MTWIRRRRAEVLAVVATANVALTLFQAIVVRAEFIVLASGIVGVAAFAAAAIGVSSGRPANAGPRSSEPA